MDNAATKLFSRLSRWHNEMLRTVEALKAERELLDGDKDRIEAVDQVIEGNQDLANLLRDAGDYIGSKMHD